MKYSLTIEGQEHALEVQLGDPLACVFDGVRFSAELAEVRPGVYSVLMGEKCFAVRVDAASIANIASNGRSALQNGDYTVEVDGVSYQVFLADPRRRRRGGTRLALSGRQVVKSPMPGKVIRLLVSEGQAVAAGQGLIVVEAMKMQNEIKSPKAGSIGKIPVREGQTVNAGEPLLVVE